MQATQNSLICSYCSNPQFWHSSPVW